MEKRRKRSKVCEKGGQILYFLSPNFLHCPAPNLDIYRSYDPRVFRSPVLKVSSIFKHCLYRVASVSLNISLKGTQKHYHPGSLLPSYYTASKYVFSHVFTSRIARVFTSTFPGSLQDMDQLSVFRSICKGTIRVTRVRDIQEELTEALCLAVSGTPGPVLVEIPVDILYPYHLGSCRYSPWYFNSNWKQQLTNKLG